MLPNSSNNDAKKQQQINTQSLYSSQRGETPQDDDIIYFKPKNIHSFNTLHNNKHKYNSEKNEYVPDLDFTNIVNKWEKLDTELTSAPPSSSSSTNISPIFNYNHSQVDSIPLPTYNLTTTTTFPSTLELERRSSYLNFLSNNNNNNKSTSIKTSLRQPFNSPFIPRSRRPSSLRRLSSPLNITSNDNNNNNNSSNIVPAPLPIIPTDTTMASIDVNMSSTTTTTTTSQSFSSLSQYNRSTLPIPIYNNTTIPTNDPYKQYFNKINNNNNNNNTINDEEEPMNKEDLFNLIKSLPKDFLNLPYSQRKSKILNLLPNDKINNYKEIMSLIKKISVSSSMSNSSLNSLNNNNNNNQDNNNTIEIPIKNNKSGLSLKRHNSLASQYLSTFSPSNVSIQSLNNNNNIQQTQDNISSSINSNFIRPNEKGMQLFDYTLESIIGYGAWGMIRKCTSNNNGSLKAVKIIKFKNNEKIKDRVIREINIWYQLKHQNILPLLKYQIDNNYAIYCLTELFEDGTLYDLVLSWDNLINSKISNDTRCKIITFLSRQIIDALNYLHNEMEIIHGDIKLENCLLQKNHKDFNAKNWNIVLCDFGMSYYIKDCIPRTKSSDSHVGSLPYASPELLLENNLTPKADIWAFGVMLYTMLVGKLPFKHQTESHLRELITSGQYDKQPLYQVCLNNYKELIDIVVGCLTVDLNQRIHLETIKNKLDSLFHHLS